MESTKQKEYVLKAIDRCDQCGAQAYILVKGMSGELMFCGHHYNKIVNDPEGYRKMMDFAYEVTDERERLVQNRQVGDSY